MRKNPGRFAPIPTAAVVIVFTLSVRAPAAQVDGVGMTIQEAVRLAVQNYPAVSVAQEQINAAAAGIQLARTAYLPRVDSLAQVNRATRNNVFGLLQPQGVLPSISGPVLGSNNFGTVWNSAVGVLISWEPFDFGLRHATVSAAEAARTYAETGLKRSQFEVAAATADACLTLAAARATVRAAQASVDRAEVLVRTVQAQVDAQLRPGADASRARADLAAARTQLVQAEQAVEVARTVVAQFVGVEPRNVSLSIPRLQDLPAERPAAPLDVSRNPAAVEQTAAVDLAKANLDAIEKSYAPRFLALGSAYARGSGAEVDGGRLGGVNGLAPNIQNYALGFSVTFSLFDRQSIRAKQNRQSATFRAEAARYQQINTEVTARWNAATAALDGARKVAANTPVQVTAAEAASQQANARYQAGLGTLVEAADAQRLLTQAQIDDALARLNVWRDLLGVAIAAGDLQPFFTEVGL